MGQPPVLGELRRVCDCELGQRGLPLLTGVDWSLLTSAQRRLPH